MLVLSEQEIISKLVDKSIEAFLVGLEIYNKPTIRYRVEGFSFFIINAWELMLKAELMQRGEPIYYRDNPERTLSVNEVIRRIYTDKRQPLRLNLERIIELRNTSTHFITEDYEAAYAPLFQACVLNFAGELNRFHKREISDYIQQNFLMLSATAEPLTNEQIRLKYPAEIAERFIRQANAINVDQEQTASDRFTIPVRQNLYIVRSKKDADFTVRVEKESANPVAIVKDIKNPADTHRYTYHNVIDAVNTRLAASGTVMHYVSGGREHTEFNSYTLQLFIRFYDLKSDERYAYKYVIGDEAPRWTYSQHMIDFIVGEIVKAPDEIIGSLKRQITPGA